MKKMLFAVFSVICVDLYGQDYFAHLPTNYAADTSIIRKYTGEWSVVYTQSATAGNYFHLVNMNTGNMYSIDVEEEVTDMEILDDTLYYCGTLQPYYSILNFFPLQQFYTGNIYIRRGRITPPAVFLVPKKLEVFRVTDGVHAVVVGDYFPPNSSRTDSYIADFWRYHTNTSWQHIYMYTDDKECYDDIAVTDNYVVASAHVCHSTDIILRVLDKPLIVCPSGSCLTNYHIFFNCTLTNTCEYTTYDYNGYDYKKPGGHGEYSICLTHTSGDHVALACMVDLWDRSGISVKDIEIVSGTPMVVQNIVDIEDGFLDLWDIRYNFDNDSLLLLVKQSLPDGSRDGIVKLDNSNFSSFTFTYPLMPDEEYEMNSIDWGNYIQNPHSLGDKVHRKMISGLLRGESGGEQTKLWSDFLSDTYCYETLLLEKTDFDGKMNQARLPFQGNINLYIYSSSVSRVVTQSSIVIDCGEMNEEYPE